MLWGEMFSAEGIIPDETLNCLFWGLLNSFWNTESLTMSHCFFFFYKHSVSLKQYAGTQEANSLGRLSYTTPEIYNQCILHFGSFGYRNKHVWNESLFNSETLQSEALALSCFISPWCHRSLVDSLRFGVLRRCSSPSITHACGPHVCVSDVSGFLV